MINVKNELNEEVPCNDSNCTIELHIEPYQHENINICNNKKQI